MMTTMAALLAGIPLALGQGMGSELRRPLGIAMVGGLLLSQVLTLYTTPVIYIFFDRIGQRFSRSRKAIEAAASRKRRREHEYLRPLHPAAGSHHPADGGHHACRGHRLQRAACFSLAASGFSDHLGFGRLARRKSGDHGVLDCNSAGAPVQPYRRRDGDDLIEFAGQHLDHPAVRSEPRHRRRGARRGGGHQRRAHLSAGQPARQPDLSQGESRGCADHDSGAYLGQVRQADAL